MPYPLGHRTSDVFLTPPASKSAPYWFVFSMTPRQSTRRKPLSFSAAVRLMLLKEGLPCQTQGKLACPTYAALPSLREKQDKVVISITLRIESFLPGLVLAAVLVFWGKGQARAGVRLFAVEPIVVPSSFPLSLNITPDIPQSLYHPITPLLRYGQHFWQSSEVHTTKMNKFGATQGLRD